MSDLLDMKRIDSDQAHISFGRRAVRAVDNWIYRSVTAVMAGAISMFSPARGASYRFGRVSYRNYTAASRLGPNRKWLPRNTTADSEIKRAHKDVMARCRDLIRNNGYISGALDKFCDNVIRNGFRIQIRLRLSNGKLNDKLNSRLEAHFYRWARKKNCDVCLHDSLWSILRTVLRHMWSDGEVLIHRVWDISQAKKGVIPFRIEILECDMLADHLDGDQGNGIIAKRGIGYSKITGEPVKYYLLPCHPGDYQELSTRNKIIEIPASEIIHPFEKERASQSRGISWFSAIVMQAYDWGEYQDYEMVGAKCAAAFGAFLKTNFPEYGANLPDISGLSDAATSPPKYIAPGMIQILPMGTEMQLASHNRPGVTYEPFVKTGLKGLSAGVGMSYSSFSNDYTDSSYSADRSSKLDERLSFRGQQDFIIEKVMEDLTEWLFEGLYVGNIEDMPGYVSNPETYTEAVDVQPPGWTLIDPLKDAKAATEDLKNVNTTHTKLLIARGDDFDDVVDQSLYEETRLLELNKLRAQNAQLIAAAAQAQTGGNTNADTATAE